MRAALMPIDTCIYIMLYLDTSGRNLVAAAGSFFLGFLFFFVLKNNQLNYVDGLVSLYLVESIETSETEEVRTFE